MWLIIIIIIITKTMFMVLSSWQSHCESSPGSFDECSMAPSGRWPKTKPDDLGCESAYTGCQKLHPPSPFIIITQPESWYLFYRPTEGRRLSRPSWLVLTRSDVGATTLIEANALPLTLPILKMQFLVINMSKWIKLMTLSLRNLLRSYVATVTHFFHLPGEQRRQI